MSAPDRWQLPDCIPDRRMLPRLSSGRQRAAHRGWSRGTRAARGREGCPGGGRGRSGGVGVLQAAADRGGAQLFRATAAHGRCPRRRHLRAAPLGRVPDALRAVCRDRRRARGLPRPIARPRAAGRALLVRAARRPIAGCRMRSSAPPARSSRTTIRAPSSSCPTGAGSGPPQQLPRQPFPRQLRARRAVPGQFEDRGLPDRRHHGLAGRCRGWGCRRRRARAPALRHRPVGWRHPADRSRRPWPEAGSPASLPATGTCWAASAWARAAACWSSPISPTARRRSRPAASPRCRRGRRIW